MYYLFILILYCQ